MSKDMINRLIEITGKNFDRQDLDDIQASQKAQFWLELQEGERQVLTASRRE
ncbi:hypothetical protein PR002_g31581, partial [Phytophthora rubi]